MTDSTIRVAAAQIDPHLGEVEFNLDRILSDLTRAAVSGSKLVVFPECALTGYGFNSREEAFSFAEAIPGPSSLRVAEKCRELGLHVVFGLLERDGAELYNSCVLVGPDGVIGSYRKVHLPFLGVDRFTDPGNRPFQVESTGDLKVGMHICYDGAFPESARVLTLLGAELLVLPTNWPVHSECQAEHMIPTRAMENVVNVIAVNRVGEERGFRFIGRSSIVDTTGTRLAFGSEDREELLIADISPALARQKRLIRRPGLHELDRIGDRRPSFYDLLTQSDAPKQR